MKNKKVEFMPPANAVPEGTMEGEDFVETCTFRVKERGMVCLVEFGDIRMPGYDDKAGAKEERPSYKKYNSGIMQTGGDGDAMPVMQGPNGGGGY